MDEVTTMNVELVPPGKLATPPVNAPLAPAQTPAEFSGKRGDFARDMAFLAAEQESRNPIVPEPTPEPVQKQPEITIPAVAPVTVPDKFKAPDGGLDEGKVAKATAGAEAALAKYAEKEKQMRAKMAEVQKLSQYQGQTAQPTVGPVVSNTQLSPFEIQVANDLINESAAFGGRLPEWQAIAQARVQIKMAEAQHAAEQKLTETIRVKLEDEERRKELETIAEYDSTVLSPEGFEALSKIREEKPWINQSLTPWTEAHRYYLADQMMKQRQAGQVQPNPTGLTARPPATPVGPAPRVVVQPTGPDLNSQASIDAYVKNLSPEDEAKFWRSRGLRF